MTYTPVRWFPPDRIRSYISSTRGARPDEPSNVRARSFQRADLKRNSPYFRTDPLKVVLSHALALRDVAIILTGKKVFRSPQDWCGIRVIGTGVDDDGMLMPRSGNRRLVHTVHGATCPAIRW